MFEGVRTNLRVRKQIRLEKARASDRAPLPILELTKANDDLDLPIETGPLEGAFCRDSAARYGT